MNLAELAKKELHRSVDTIVRRPGLVCPVGRRERESLEAFVVAETKLIDQGTSVWLAIVARGERGVDLRVSA